MIVLIMSLCVFYLSFLSIFNPIGPINLPFAHFCVCHISLLSCCSFIFIPLLLSFYSGFFLSLILSFPSLTWTLIVHVSVRKRGKMCEISHRDFIIIIIIIAHGWSVSWSDQVLRNQHDTHTHTHTHTHQPTFHTLAHSYILIVLH